MKLFKVIKRILLISILVWLFYVSIKVQNNNSSTYTILRCYPEIRLKMLDNISYIIYDNYTISLLPKNQTNRQSLNIG